MGNRTKEQATAIRKNTGGVNFQHAVNATYNMGGDKNPTNAIVNKLIAQILDFSKFLTFCKVKYKIASPNVYTDIPCYFCAAGKLTLNANTISVNHKCSDCAVVGNLLTFLSEYFSFDTADAVELIREYVATQNPVALAR